MAGLVAVRSFTHVHDALLARTVLEAAGLDVSLANEHLVSIYNLWSNAVGGVKVMVPAEQAQEADEILDSEATVEDEDAASMPVSAVDRCPRCEGTEVESFVWGRRPAIFSLLLAGVPLFPVRRLRRCRHCGASLSAARPRLPHD